MRGGRIISALRRFRRDDNGVALVEFAIFLPIFLLAFFVIVEFGRTFFNYQGALAGVRDATRYAARTMDKDICVGESNGSGAVVDPSDALAVAAYNTVERNLLNETGVLPTNIRIRRVTLTYRCVVRPTWFRQREIPVVRVQARLEVILPLGEILELNGRPVLNNIVTSVTDETRVYGL